MASTWDEMVEPEFGDTMQGPDGQPMVFLPPDQIPPEMVEQATPSTLPVSQQQRAQDLAKTYELKHRELIAQQQAGVDQLSNQVNQYAQQKPEFDTRPLLALADMFDPTAGYSRMAQAPSETKAQRDAKIMALREGLQQRKESLTKSQMDGLKEQLQALKFGQPDPMQGLKAEELKSRIRMQNAAGGFKQEKEAQNVRESFVKSDDAKIIKANVALQNRLQEYEDAVTKYGFEATGEGKAKLETAYNKLGLQYKESQKLGALTGPDWEIVQGTIRPTTGYKGVINEVTGGGAQGTLQSIKALKQSINEDQNTFQQSAATIYPEPLVSEYVSKLNKTVKKSVNSTQDPRLKRIQELRQKQGK